MSFMVDGTNALKRNINKTHNTLNNNKYNVYEYI